ncbi:MAG: nucleotidyltransferase domain-containing protein [Chloroflexota bacterium]|nr:nucleotidyltransferase domain-containing protein [Chloroflexota bacterium]
MKIREQLLQRRRTHIVTLQQELARLVKESVALGVQRIVLFGSMAREEAGLFSDLDLLIVWDTPLSFLERTVALYRALQPQVAVDLLVYTPAEMIRMKNRPFIHHVLEQGEVLYAN